MTFQHGRSFPPVFTTEGSANFLEKVMPRSCGSRSKTISAVGRAATAVRDINGKTHENRRLNDFNCFLLVDF